MKKRTSNPTLIERIHNLSLIQNDYFNYAVQNSTEFVKALIDPVLHYLGIKDYEIISVEPQKNISNGLNRDVIYDCLIKLKNSSFIIIEIQNTHSDRMTIKRIRFEQSVFDSKQLKPGEDFYKLPNLISIIYTKEPLAELDNGQPVADLVLYNKNDDKIIDNGIRTFVINGKYKLPEFSEFTDVIEDLIESNPEKIKNPVMRDIHLKTKNTEEGTKMWLELMDEEMREDYLRMQKENREKQIIINNLMDENEKQSQQFKEELEEKEKQSQQFKEELEEARNLIEKLQKENESMKLNLK